MIANKSNSRINRLVVLATTLLISNILALSCAMAFSMDADCAKLPSVQCVEMFDVAEIVVNDKAPDETHDPRPPVTNSNALLTSNLNFASANAKISACNTNFRYPSPSLNLLYCIFLK